MSKNDAKLNPQQSAIFAIGNLIISDTEKLKLWMIVWKIHQYLPLSQALKGLVNTLPKSFRSHRTLTKVARIMVDTKFGSKTSFFEFQVWNKSKLDETKLFLWNLG